MNHKEVNEPYRDNKLTENVRIRRFSESVRDEDLVWHRDERDRTITILEGRGWQFQRDNELPQEMRPGQVIEVRAGEWHRVIKGAGQLHTIILESKNVISEQAQQLALFGTDELKVEPKKQKAESTSFEVKWDDESFKEVGKDTPQAVGIRLDDRQYLFTSEFKFDARLYGPGLISLEKFHQFLVQGDGLKIQLQFSGLQTGEFKEIIDHKVQLFRLISDDLQVFIPFVFFQPGRLFQETQHKTTDSGERRLHVVGEHGNNIVPFPFHGL